MKVGSLVRVVDYGAWTGYVGLIVEHRAEVHEASGVYHRVMVANMIKHFNERHLEVIND
tara:strand:- start:347 stop:523 length:177 start_codon:yes stop_codon:yes gene_type:complete